MKSKLLVAVVLAIHISTVFAQTYKDAYGNVWYMTAINDPQWNEKALVGYPVVDDGSAYVYKIVLSTTALSIPTALPWSSGGSAPDAHPSIEYLTCDATANHPYLTTVSVNRSTELRAPYFRNCSALKEFQYETLGSRDTGILLNSKYAVQGGVLYDGQLADLKKYPEGKDGDVFTVPASVVSLHQFTFANTKLKKIVFEGNAPKIIRDYSGDTWRTVSNTVVSGSSSLSIVCHRQDASGWGTERYRNWCGISIYAIPNAVTGLAASQGTSSRGVELTWEENEVATNYDVYRADSETGAKSFVGDTWSASYLDKTAIPQRRYYYWIVPRNYDVEGAISGVVVGYADDPKFHFKETNGEAELVLCECAGGPLEIPQTSESGLPVTRIGGYAVSECEGVTELTVPSSLRDIGNGAFKGCQRLSSVVIPEGVTRIGQHAFRGCYDLKQVSLPTTIKTIERSAFFYCDSLESINLHFGIEKIGDEAFYACHALASITIPEGVTSIGASAFYGCRSLTSIKVPESVTRIGESAFSGCSGLADADGFVIVRNSLYGYYGDSTMLTIPENVTRIEAAAFKWRNSLVSVVIPERVTHIGEYAFESCHSLKQVTLPSTLWVLEEGTFYYCDSLERVNWEPGIESIGDRAFYYCGALTTIEIPESVTSIGAEAFYGCESLTSVTMPESEVDIGERAFHECPGLVDADGFVIVGGVLCDYEGDATEITIPQGVTKIGAEAFEYQSAIASVVMPEGLTSIGADAFYGCDALTSIRMPESVTAFGERAFGGCTGLADADGFVIVKGVLYDYVGDASEIVIPESVTSIGAYAFSGCDSMVSITIPESVMAIGPCAFNWCGLLTSVSMPDHAIDIDEQAFDGCYGLADADGFVVVRGILCGYGRDYEDESVKLTIPENVTVIGTGVFCEYDALVSVTIPDGVMNIGSNAFAWCESLSSVVMPSSVTNIGENAFSECCKLMTVIVEPGDAHRVIEMLEASRFDVSGVEFIAKEGSLDSTRPALVGDSSAIVTGDAEKGFVIRSSTGMENVNVMIPDGLDAAKVTVVLSPETKTVTPNGAAVRIVRGEADITDFLDLPAAVDGVIDLGAATVKQEIERLVLDPAQGAVVDLSATDPQLTTAPTKEGLVYRLKEGATLEAMEANATGDSTIGDGQPWTPMVTVRGGANGFYSIRVSK